MRLIRDVTLALLGTVLLGSVGTALFLLGDHVAGYGLAIPLGLAYCWGVVLIMAVLDEGRNR